MIICTMSWKKSRYNTSNIKTQQWNIQRINWNNRRETTTISTCPTQQPSNSNSGTSNKNFSKIILSQFCMVLMIASQLTNGIHWLIHQVVITLNMLRPSRINLQLLAYNQILGNFDFDKTPLALAACKAVINDRPENQQTFDNHGALSYYIDLAEHHYRKNKCYIPETKAIRISNTVEFFPKLVQMPKISFDDRLAAVLEDLSEVWSIHTQKHRF